MPPRTRGLALLLPLLLLSSSSLVCAVEVAHNGKQTHVLASCGTGRLPTPVKAESCPRSRCPTADKALDSD